MSLRRWVPPIIALLLVLNLSTAANADLEDDLKDVEDGIAELNQLISQQGEQRTQLQLDLEAAEVRLITVREELVGAETAVAAGIEQLANAASELTRIEEALEQGAVELATTRLEISQTGEELTRRAVESYMNHVGEVPGGFLSVSSVTDVLIGAEYADQALKATEVAVGNLEALKGTEVAQQDQVSLQKGRQLQVVADLERGQDALELAQDAVEAKKSEVEIEVAAQAALLAEVLKLIEELDGEVSKLESDAASITDEIKQAQQPPSTPTPPASGYRWPVSGVLTSPFGYRIHPITGVKKLHTGIDIGAPNGRTIVAVEAGTVIVARYYGGYGNAVVIDHGGGVTTLYAHMSHDAVSTGQSIGAGETVGYIGSTGFSTGNHLHFEIRENGTPVNPLNYLP